MTKARVEWTGEVARKTFELLLREAAPVPERVVFERLRQAALHGGSPDAFQSYGVSLQVLDGIVRVGAIAATKAGWLRTDGGLWSVTEQGRQEYERYPNPGEFLIRAGRKSFRGWVAIHFPACYRFLTRSLDQMRIEVKMVRRIGVGRLTREILGISMPRMSSLPLQSPLKIVVPHLQLRTLEQLREYLASLNLQSREGAHALYMGPDIIEASAFKIIRDYYPSDAGLKVMKNPGRIQECSYFHGEMQGISQLHKKLIYKLPTLCLVANFFHSKNLGPRVYDLVELQCGDQVWSAYVVEHVQGEQLSPDACAVGLGQIRELERQGWIKSNLPDGWQDEEFEHNGFNDNVLQSERGEFRYIDFQNFLLVNHGKYLKDVAVRSCATSHWGDRNFLRGGLYIYHTVPSLRLPGRRDTGYRGSRLAQLLSSAGVTIRDRLVLDIGCNVGMMMGQYLHMGARWCHGWDMPEITSHTRELLLAIGCTRFSLTGAALEQNRSLEADLPGFLKPHLPGCVISYLAVREPLGWMNDLSRIPWSVLIYEGHEDDSQNDFENYMAELGRIVTFHLGSVARIKDGDCDSRTVAVLIRDTSHVNNTPGLR